MKFIGNKMINFNMKMKVGKEHIPEVNTFKYLGLNINNKMDFNQTFIENFEKVRKAMFSLNSFWNETKWSFT